MTVKFDPNAAKANTAITIDETFDKARGPLKTVISIGANIGLQYAIAKSGSNIGLPLSLTDESAEASINQSQTCAKKSAEKSIDLYAWLFGKK
jgi:hypothetical protein